MPTENIPELPKLDEEDIEAVRQFLPGKLLGRIAAFLSVCLLVLVLANQIKQLLHGFIEDTPSSWATLIAALSAALATSIQLIREWRAKRNRQRLRELAITVVRREPSYFQIGPYRNTAEDRKRFKRGDRAEEKIFEWIKQAALCPLYLIGDSGSGKTSLLNAYVIPNLMEEGWTVIATRAWQDPQAGLREMLSTLPMMQEGGSESVSLGDALHRASKNSAGRILIILDQFEEFLILAKQERQTEFAAFIAQLQGLRTAVVLLLSLRSEYESLLTEIGLPLPRSGENLFLLGRFRFSEAMEFMRQSPLKLQPDSLDSLMTSAAEMDGTPGLVRPITLNVIGYVLSANVVAPSLDAGAIVRGYIEQTVQQPAIRNHAPRILEHMITEQGTKQPRSELDLGESTKLRHAEVRAVLNALEFAGLSRPLDPEREVWELSHDFIARAVARLLGRLRRQAIQHAVSYVVPTLAVVSMFGALWLSQPYLKWFFVIRPYIKNHVRPFVLKPEIERALTPGESFRECEACPEMVVLPPSRQFRMGTTVPEERGPGDLPEQPPHEVSIRRFAVARYDTTFDEWYACANFGGCRSNPRPGNGGWENGRRPAINVNWNDAQEYVTWLSKITGRNYRLLSEAEWEYSTRANTQTAYYWGDVIGSNNANCQGCGSQWDNMKTAPVGSFKPNGFGLYDMAGNVLQWVLDCMHQDYVGAPKDGSAWLAEQRGDCGQRILRGGAWGQRPVVLRSAERGWDNPDKRTDFVGFRVAREL